LVTEIRQVKSAAVTLQESLTQQGLKVAGHQERVVGAIERVVQAQEAVTAKLEQPVPQAKVDTELTDKVTQLLEVMGTHGASAPAPSNPPSEETKAQASSAPVVAQAAPEARPTSRRQRLKGWVLRDVYNGNAIIETPQRVLYEVGPGRTVVGLGRIEGLQRQGRRWVVVTSKGTITPDRSL
jgi:hypothetical protein